MSLRHAVEAGELHRAAITMTRGPHADGQRPRKNRGRRTRLIRSPPSKTVRAVTSAINFTAPLQTALKPGSRRHRNNLGEISDFQLSQS
jgi:hypothetical protein